MQGSDVIAVEPGEAAGALVYWSLSGNVDLLDLSDTLVAESLDEFVPDAPSKETTLHRALQATVRSKRELVRPLGGKRAGYVFVQERLSSTEGRNLEHVERAVCSVEKPSADLGTSSYSYKIVPVEPEDQALCDQILATARAAEGVLTPNDVSTWLLSVLRKHVQAVGLRERGGIYFVPRDRLDAWREIVRVLRACSSHALYEIPAMRTDEAVEAILAAVRGEAAGVMAEMEEYLCGDVSTKGLNSWERRHAELQGKLRHYAELLGVALPDLTDKLENLIGALQAARIMHAQAEDVAAQ